MQTQQDSNSADGGRSLSTVELGGGKLAPMPTEKEMWMAKYVIRMVEKGIAAEDAWACCRAGENDHDYTSDPCDAADDEMSYWSDDGDVA